MPGTSVLGRSGWLVRQYGKLWVHSYPPGTGDDEGQHPCSRQPPEWCDGSRIVTADDGTARREPALTYQAFCRACRARIITCLEELPSGYERLGVALTDPLRFGTPVRAMPGSRVLLNPDADALMRQTAAVLHGWAARVRAVARRSVPDPRRRIDTPDAVKDAVGVLLDHADALLALQPGWTTRTYPLPLPEGAEELIGGEEIVRAGDGYVTVMTRRDGAAAGNEILSLHYRARRMLGETRRQPESFDGIPCRACDEMALERAEPPSDPAMPAMHSRCATCHDLMSRAEFTEWAVRYAKWAETAGLPACRRCQAGKCPGCAWDACPCAARGHAAA